MAFEDDYANDDINTNNNNNDIDEVNDEHYDSNDEGKIEIKERDLEDIIKAEEERELRRKHVYANMMRRKYSLTVEPEVHETLKHLALRYGLTPKKMLSVILADYIENAQSNKTLKYIHERKDKLKTLIESRKANMGSTIHHLLTLEPNDKVGLVNHTFDLLDNIEKLATEKAEKYLLDLAELANILQHYQHIGIVEKLAFAEDKDKLIKAFIAKLETNNENIAKALEPLKLDLQNKENMIYEVANKLNEIQNTFAEIRNKNHEEPATELYMKEAMQSYIRSTIETNNMMQSLAQEIIKERLTAQPKKNDEYKQLLLTSFIAMAQQLMKAFSPNTQISNTTANNQDITI
jgi:hypothetical protein